MATYKVTLLGKTLRNDREELNVEADNCIVDERGTLFLALETGQIAFTSPEGYWINCILVKEE